AARTGRDYNMVHEQYGTPPGGARRVGCACVEERVGMDFGNSAGARISRVRLVEDYRCAERGRTHGAGTGAASAEPGGSAGFWSGRNRGGRPASGAAAAAVGSHTGGRPAGGVSGLCRKPL